MKLDAQYRAVALTIPVYSLPTALQRVDSTGLRHWSVALTLGLDTLGLDVVTKTTTSKTYQVSSVR